MKKAPGRKIDKTFIKEAGVKSIKPSRIIQSIDFAIGNINVAVESISGKSEEFDHQ